MIRTAPAIPREGGFRPAAGGLGDDRAPPRTPLVTPALRFAPSDPAGAAPARVAIWTGAGPWVHVKACPASVGRSRGTRHGERHFRPVGCGQRNQEPAAA